MRGLEILAQGDSLSLVHSPPSGTILRFVRTSCGYVSSWERLLLVGTVLFLCTYSFNLGTFILEAWSMDL